MKKEIINNTLSIMIDGTEVRTKEQLLTIMKEALSFPDYFGMNWDALDECIKDLSWLKEIDLIEILITNSIQILSLASEKDKTIFHSIMNTTVDYWTNTGTRLVLFIRYK